MDIRTRSAGPVALGPSCKGCAPSAPLSCFCFRLSSVPVPDSLFSSDQNIVLDPAVELTPTAIRAQGGWNLCHHHWGTAMVVPNMAGLDELLDVLDTPEAIEALIEAYDTSRGVLESGLRQLVALGFAYCTPSGETPDEAQLATLRTRWAEHRQQQVPAERTLRLGEASAGEIAACTGDVRLVSERLEVHGEIFAELARTRPAATRLVVETGDATCASEVIEALFLLGAIVRITGLEWPPPEVTPEAIARLVRGRVEVQVVLPASALLTPPQEIAAWAERLHLSAVWLGLGSALDPDRVDDLDARLRALERTVINFRVLEFPSDEEIAGRKFSPQAQQAPVSADLGELRRRYLRRRIEYLRWLEAQILNPQVPEAEPLAHEDALTPFYPSALKLGPGKVLLEVGSGLGRVSRRLSPEVGAEGRVVAIDRDPLVVYRGADVARELGFTNLQFRAGDARALALPDGSVDAVIAEGLLDSLLETGHEYGDAERGHPTPERAVQAISEMARVLKPGGRLMLSAAVLNLGLQDLELEVIEPRNMLPFFREALAGTGLELVDWKLWGVPGRLSRAPLAWFHPRALPRMIDDLAGKRFPKYGQGSVLFYAVIGEKRGAAGASREALSVQSYRSIDQIPAGVWEAITRREWLHHSRPFLRGHEQLEPTYLVVSRDGRPVGGALYYLCKSQHEPRLTLAYTPYDHHFVHLRDEDQVPVGIGPELFYPAILVGPPRGGRTELLLVENLPAEVRELVLLRILEELEGAARRAGAKIIYTPGLEVAALRELDGYIGRNISVYGWVDHQLELPSTWEAYLASFSGKRRRRLTTSMSKLEERGWTYRTTLLGESRALVERLYGESLIKWWGDRWKEAFAQDMCTLDSTPPEDVFVNVARKSGEDLALIVMIRAGRRFYNAIYAADEARVDPEDRKLGLYDSLMFGVSVEHAIRSGITSIDYGGQSSESKLRHGCSMRCVAMSVWPQKPGPWAQVRAFLEAQSKRRLKYDAALNAKYGTRPDQLQDDLGAAIDLFL